MENNTNDAHASKINTSISELLNSKTTLKRRKKTIVDKKREKFIDLILIFEKVCLRSEMMHSDLGLDFSTYEDPFYTLIEGLIELKYNKKVLDIIYFYIYERLDEEGNNKMLLDEEGNPIPLSNPGDLWDVIQVIMSENA